MTEQADARAGARAETLVGRDEELAAVDMFLDRVPDRGAATVLLGEVGIGKSVLLAAAIDRAARRGMRVLTASGAEFETEMTFAGLHQLLVPIREAEPESWKVGAEVLDVALGFSSGQAPDRLVVANAVLSVLRCAAGDAGVVMVVDDLQWIDRTSATALAMVARRVEGNRIGFLGAMRSDEDGFFEHAALPELAVLPLDREQSNDLLDDQFPSLARHRRQEVLEESRGNPLALLELGSAASRRVSSGLAAGYDGLSPRRRLQTLFAARIAALPEDARELLVLAALERSGDLGVLEAATTVPGGIARLEPAERAGLVSVDADVTFRHPLIRHVVVGESTKEERRAAHRALAVALARQPERRAWHLAEAAIGPDESVAWELEDAARRSLQRGDAPGAVAALTRASELTPDEAARGRRLAQAAYLGSSRSGALSDASSLLEAARRAALEGAGSLYAATAAAYLLFNGDGDVDTAYLLLTRAIENERDDPQADPAAMEQALRALDLLCYVSMSAERWAYFIDVLAVLPTPPAALSLSVALFADPIRASADALARLDDAIEGLRDADAVHVVGIARAGVFVDRVPDCRAALIRVVKDGRAGDGAALAVPALSMLATSSNLTGRWEEAERFSRQSLELAEQLGFGLSGWFPRQNKMMLAAFRGDEATTQQLVSEMMRWATPRRVRSAPMFWNLALHFLALGSGDFEAAYQRAAAITPPGQLAPHASSAVYALLGFVEAAVRTDRAAEAAAHVGAMRAANVSAISSRLALEVAASEALVAPEERRTESFERALTTPDADRWPFHFARVQLVFGEHLRRARAITQARAQLEAALTTFESLGARAFSARAALELRAAGVGKAASHGGRGEALTAQELEVATLAASGLTNKQIGEQLFMSPRTVGAHLYRIFPKLGITSRAALRDALNARGYDQPR